MSCCVVLPHSDRPRLQVRLWVVMALLISQTVPVRAQTQTSDHLFSRELKLVEFTTPGEWSFFKYIDNPVSLYKGIPDVSLTLYTLVDGGIEIPLTLRYNTSGIQVEEEAGWVGLGWNLNIGGFITREIVGGYDDRDDTFDSYKTLFYKPGLGYVNTHGGDSMTRDMYNEIVYTYPETGQYHWGKLAPDVYYFSYPGNAGKYVTDWRDRTVSILQREQDILIDNFVTPSAPGEPTGKIITTPEGVRHHFQYFDLVRTHENLLPLSETYPLTRSVYPNGDEVSYSYQNAVFTRTKYSSYYAGSLSSPSVPNGSFYEYSELLHDTAHLEGTESILSTITTPNYLIVFQSSTRLDNSSRKLDCILIKDMSSGTILKKFVFSYDYFIPSRTVPSSRRTQEYRLKLTSVSEQTPSGQGSINTFSFGYNTTDLPPKDSYNSDWWGYPNANAADNQAGQRAPDLSRLYWDRISTGSDYSRIGGISCAKYEKGHNYLYCQAGMLTSISYPTGGMTRFEYESNSFKGVYIPSVSEPVQAFEREEMSIQDRNHDTDVRNGSFTLSTPATIHIDYELDRGLNSWSDVAQAQIAIPYPSNAVLLDFAQQCAALAASGSAQQRINGSFTVQRPAGVTVFEVRFPDALGDQHTSSGGHGSIRATISYRIPSEEGQTPDTSHGCGMRVARITHHDSPSGEAVKTVSYSYTDQASGQTSGHLFDFPRLVNIYEYAGYSYTNPETEAVLEPDIINTRQFEVFDSPVRTNPYGRSSGVGYNCVTVEVSGVPGKTVYRFRNDDAHDAAFSYRTDTALNGKLLSKTDYDSSGSAVRCESYSYDERISKWFHGVNLINQWRPFPNLVNGSDPFWAERDFMPYWTTYYPGVYSIIFYELNQHDITLSSTTATLDGVSSTTHYEYDPQSLLLCSSCLTGSDGSTLKTEYKYPGDFSFAPYSSLSDNHIIAPVVETRLLRSGALIDAVLTTRDNEGFLVGQYIGKVSPGTSVAVTPFIGLSPNPALYPSASLLSENRDSRGNPLQITIGGSDHISYTWGYGGRYPTSETRGTGNEALGSQYSYDALGNMLSHEDPAGHISSWTYDAYGRLSSESRRNSQATELLISYAYGDEWISRSTRTSEQGAAFTDKLWYTGLGLPDQELGIEAVPSGNTRVTPYVYDGALREAGDWLPYIAAAAADGRQTSVLNAQAAYWRGLYLGESEANSQLQYEDSPVSRISTVYGIGETLHGTGHGDSYRYRSNAEGEVRKFSVSAASDILSSAGYWPEGELYAEEHTDPDGCLSIVFTDKYGLKILERSFISTSATADTYCVYDGMLNLRYVLPPGASAQLGTSFSYSPQSQFAKQELYCLTYDDRHRLASVRRPGAGEEYFVYDGAGRVVASQDPRERESDRWRRLRYDDSGLLSGVYMLYSTLSLEAMQQSCDGLGYGVPVVLYEHGAYPAFFSGQAFQPVSEVVSAAELADSAAGLVTVERTVSAADFTGTIPEFDIRVHYYDRLGRIIQSVERTLSGETVRTSWQYDYRGNILKRCEQAGGITKLQEWTYDIRGRKLSEAVSMNGTQTASMAYTYDDLDRVVRLTFGNGLAEHLARNIQGWTVSTELRQTGGGILYSDILRYYDSYPGAVPRYSGALSSRTVTNGGSLPSTRLYSYDGMGRLTDAVYQEGAVSTDRYTERGITYDRSGNILGMQRSTGTGQTESLSFSYLGHRRSGYSYDSRGNLESRPGAGTTVTYNILNLPLSIHSDSSPSELLSMYTYIFDGTKAEVKDADGNGYRYLGTMRFTLEGNVTAFESTAFGGGRIVADGDGFTGEYHHKDYLSSVRLVTGTGGTVKARYEYLPFGTPVPLTGDSGTAGQHLFNSKEKQPTATLYDYGARFYDYDAAIWTAQEPLYSKYFSISPYAFCANDPVTYTDPSGRNPIYTPDGFFLGTDEKGLRGQAIVMLRPNFTQGMSHDKATTYHIATFGKEADTRIQRHMESLVNRPDWDGYITLKEANEWYRSGHGEPLFVDINKIDFSLINKRKLQNLPFDTKISINLLRPFKLRNDGMVYGNITIVRDSSDTIYSKSDTYDFDMHKWTIKSVPRNVFTIIGHINAGKGTPYVIHINGKKDLSE